MRVKALIFIILLTDVVTVFFSHFINSDLCVVMVVMMTMICGGLATG